MNTGSALMRYVWKYQRQFYWAFVLLSITGTVLLGWEFFVGITLASLHGLTQTIVGVINGYSAGQKAAHKEDVRKAFE